MSKFFDKATQKVKKKVGHKLRPSSRQNHDVVTSPASSPLARSATEDASSPTPEIPSPGIPAYARPPSPPTILATTGSAVKRLVVAARDGSDLFLPLKAALVGVVALWDIFDVCHFPSLHLILLNLDVAYS